MLYNKTIMVFHSHGIQTLSGHHHQQSKDIVFILYLALLHTSTDRHLFSHFVLFIKSYFL